MNRLNLAFVALGVLLMGLATLPNAAADPAADAASASIGLLQCYSYSFDADHDGSADPWTECSTPACGCNCPYVGAGAVIEAAPLDREVGVFAITSGCQTAYGTEQSPSDGGFAVTPLVFVGGGGLGPILCCISSP